MPDPATPALALDVAYARAQFPALAGDWVFMDNAGGSQILGSVVDRIRDYLVTSNVQLGATYDVSVLAARRMRDAQVSLAELLNAARPDEVVMGPSSTALLYVLARAMAPRLSPGDEIIVTRMDHESNIGPWAALEERGVTIRFWEFDRDRLALELNTLDRLMTARTRLVAVTQVSNIFGEIVPIDAITQMVHARGAQIAVDGVAYAPHRAVDVQASDVDYFVCSLYKIFGPHYAVLFGKHDHLVALSNQNHFFVPDDRIPYKFQAGGPNYELSHGAAGIADYLVALGDRSGAPVGSSRRASIEAAFGAIATHEAGLAARLLDFLKARRGVRVVGPATADPATRVPTISFLVDGRDAREIVRDVDRLHIGIKYGDFHSRRLVEALGLDPASGVVRVSLVHYNTIEEVDRLIGGLERILA